MWTRRLKLVAGYGSLGMFLAGYSMAVQNASLLPLEEDFALRTSQKEWLASSTILVAALTSIFSSSVSNRLGRRPALLLSACFFIAGSACAGAAPNYAVLLVGRSVLGVGVGFASATSAMYLSETSPAEHRGVVVGLTEFMVVFGQLASCTVNALCMRVDPKGSWRFPMGIAVLPAAVQLVGLALLPETPRWLVQAGRVDEATRVLREVCGRHDVGAELLEIQAALAGERAQRGACESLGEVATTPRLRRGLGVGIMLMVAQQIAGINAVMYYSAELLEDTFAREAAMWVSALAVLTQLLGVCACFGWIDRIGRRKIVLGSMCAVSATLALLSLTFIDVNAHQRSGGAVALMLLAMALFLFAYGFGLGTVPWVLNAEIHPMNVRALALGATLAASWVSNFTVARTFLDLCAAVGKPGAFGTYSAVSALFAVFIWMCAPA